MSWSVAWLKRAISNLEKAKIGKISEQSTEIKSGGEMNDMIF
jgi:hypothetical protein